jgi:hypothetical protein
MARIIQVKNKIKARIIQARIKNPIGLTIGVWGW